MPIDLGRPDPLTRTGDMAARLVDLARQVDRLERTGLPDVEAWTAPSFANSWVDFGGGYESAGYCLDLMGFVHLRGLVKTGTVGATVFTLPAGYRPEGRAVFAVASNGAFGQCDVTAAGAVIAVSGSNVSFSLDGIVFRAV